MVVVDDTIVCTTWDILKLQAKDDDVVSSDNIGVDRSNIGKVLVEKCEVASVRQVVAVVSRVAQLAVGGNLAIHPEFDAGEVSDDERDMETLRIETESQGMSCVDVGLLIGRVSSQVAERCRISGIVVR